ncbi:MAG: SOS response-associated peptidase [Acidimicrobiales bacterium]
MCGRFVQALTEGDISDALSSAGYALILATMRSNEAGYDSSAPMNLPARYNVAPTQQVIGLEPLLESIGDQNRELQSCTLRWGLQQGSAGTGGRSLRPINARIETLASKSFFRTAFLKGRKVVPANGYYEWQRSTVEPSKKPYFISDPTSPILLLAAISRPNHETGEQEFAALTTAAHENLRSIHDRQPVVLTPETLPLWIGEHGKPIQPLLLEHLARPLPLRAQEADPRVNSVRNDWPELITKPEETDPLFR